MLITEIPIGLIDAINGGDSLALAALADYFGEQGDEVAEEAVRWCVCNRRRPPRWSTVKYWYSPRHRHLREDSHEIPKSLLSAIPTGETISELTHTHRDFSTQFEAYIGLVEGWRQLTPLERQQVKEMRL